MRIRWNGGGVVKRVVAGYEWSAETGYEQDVVEDDLAANLLTDPSGLFVAVDEGEADALFESTDEEEVDENSDALDVFDRELSEGEAADLHKEDAGEDDLAQ